MSFSDSPTSPAGGLTGAELLGKMRATTPPPDATTTIATADLHTVYEHNGIVVMTNTTGWVQFIVVWDTGTGKGKAILQSPPPG